MAPKTQVPRALAQKRDAMLASQSSDPSAQQNDQPAPTGQSNPPAPQQSQAPAAPEIDLSAFIVEDAPGEQTAPTAPPNVVPFDQAISDTAPAPAPSPDERDRAYREDMARLQGQVHAMQQMFTHGGQQTQQQTAAQQAAERMLSVDASDLTAEEMEQYKASLPIIQKVVQRTLMEHVEPALQRLNGRTVDPKLIEQLTGQVGTATETSFKSTLSVAVPDLDDLSGHPDFATFISRNVPYTGKSVKSVLGEAYKARDVTRIREVMSDFRKQVSGDAPQATPPARAFQGPAVSASTPTPSAQTTHKKPTLALSKRRDAGLQFQKGQITKQQLDAINNLYEEAFRENRVDVNR
jgi:hypothetical protein